MFYDYPVFFEKNRVFRVYTGGKLFSDFFGDDSVDSNYPEEWVASDVAALNEATDIENEGVSVIKDTGILLTDAIRDHKKEMLGAKSEIGILTKFIDSSVRLPVQAHPDKEFSEIHFNSSHGKEESWIIIATRPGAKVFYGFKDGVTKEDFVKAIKEADEGKNSMEPLLNSLDVVPGDVVYIPAKFVHAIGAGCLLLEIQEPTDFTIQPERYCGDYRLSDKEMYMGIDPVTALDCFDFDKSYFAPLPAINIYSDDTILYQSLIGPDITKSFNVRMITLTGGEFLMDKTAAIYVVLDGSGRITGEGYDKEIKRGDYFLLPHNAVDKFLISGDIKIAECYS